MTTKDISFYLAKAQELCLLQHQTQKDNVKKAIKDYEEAINHNRIVYCGCKQPMLGNHHQSTASSLQKTHENYVFDPACSEACRERYSYFCTDCHAAQGRVYGPGYNGQLMCHALCHQKKRKQFS